MTARFGRLPRTRTIDSNSGGVVVQGPCYSETKFFNRLWLSFVIFFAL